jgi:hypothetical protein
MNSSFVLPSSLEHEQGIIVALMLDPGAAETVFSLLSPSDFYKDAHRLIIEAAQLLNEKGEPCDLPTLHLSLRASGKIEKVGGAAYLASLPDQCPIPTDLKYYCRKIAWLSEKRRLADAGSKILQAAQRMDEGLEDAGDLAQRVVAEALDRRVGHDNKSRIFDLEPIDAVDIVVPDFIINPLVEENSLFSIFGDAGTYKSIIADEMMACTATGEPFFGMSVKKGPVVYICGEGRSGVRRRFKAWEIVRQVPLDGAPLLVSNGAMALCDDAQTALTLKRLEAAADKYGPPALVVIDTLARNFGPGDENSTADMTKAVAAADRIRQLYGSAVGLVHHSGIIDKNRGARQFGTKRRAGCGIQDGHQQGKGDHP